MDQRYWTLYVGSYSTDQTEGLHTFVFDRATETFKKVGGQAGIENPSFFTLDEKTAILYAVSEVEDGEVVAYKQEDGRLVELNRTKTGGSSPCFVEVAKDHLLSVNYTGGNLAVHRIEEDGTIGQRTDFIQYEGFGPHKTRQEAPHPHTIVKDPYSDFIVVSDLGTDQIHVYRLISSTGQLEKVCSQATEKGAGPRHFAFHPTLPYLYVCQELQSTVAVYKWQRDQPSLEYTATYSTLPSSYNGENTTAEIKVTLSGDTLYCSNRGHDSLAVFRIQENGKLSPLTHVSTKGKVPRHFNMLPTEDYLFVANQDSDSIWLFRMGPDGELYETNQSLTVSKPVCLQVVELVND